MNHFTVLRTQGKTRDFAGVFRRHCVEKILNDISLHCQLQLFCPKQNPLSCVFETFAIQGRTRRS